MNLDLKRVEVTELGGIDLSDVPDFVDAFIQSGTYEEKDGEIRDLTDEELDYLNSNETDFVYDAVFNYLY